MSHSSPASNRQPSRHLTESEAITILSRLMKGDFQNRIAADLDVNQGRISEVKTGKMFPHLPRPINWKK